MINKATNNLIQQQMMHSLFLSNKEKKRRNKIKKSKMIKIIKQQNNNNKIILPIDNIVYKFNFKINYFKFYIEKYIIDLILNKNTQKANKIYIQIKPTKTRKKQ